MRDFAIRLCVVVGLTSSPAVFGCGNPGPGAEEPPPTDPVSEVEPTKLFQQGLELARGGDLVRAEQYIGAAMTRGYPEERALPLLLKVCIAASRLRIAIGYAEPYLDRHPDDWALRMLIASLYLGLDDTVKARRELEFVIESQPDEPEPHYLMALLLRDEVGDPDSAELHLRRYLELAPAGEHAGEVTHALRTIRVPLHPADSTLASEPQTPGASSDLPSSLDRAGDGRPDPNGASDEPHEVRP